jgi:hypothetical protein
MSGEFTQITTQDLWSDGQSMTISAQLVGNTLVLTWTLPPTPIVYDGAVVVVGTEPQGGLEQPADGTRYVASSNYGVPAAPNGMIGNAQVVSAFYGYFGDNTKQTTVTVTNIDPTKIYYASIYACSNVLQYYTIGCQSYPLQAGPQTKDVTPYAGSIPAAVQPPQNPTPGEAYYDPRNNCVFIYDGQQQAWARSQQATVPVGDELPLQKYQVFFLTNAYNNQTTGTTAMYFFDGSKWVPMSSQNARVKMGAAWAAFAGTAQYGSPAVPIDQQVDGGTYGLNANNGSQNTGFPPVPPATGTFALITQQAAISAPPVASLWFTSLGQWFMPTGDMVNVLVDGQWQPVAETGYFTFYGPSLPIIPKVGDFFYNTSSKRLLAWDGSQYTPIDTAQRGEPTTQKVGIGTSGLQGPRLELTSTLMNLLGYPAICVELQPDQFQVAINRALAMFRRLADNAYAWRHIAFTVYGGPTGGQATYILNDPRDGTDKIVSIIKIHRINQLGISSLSAETGLYAQAFFNQLYQGSNVDVLSIHLMNQLSQVYEKVFAGNLMFTWDEAKRELTILRRFLQAQERVLLEVVMEREEGELINDRWCGTWIQEWAEAELLMMLGLIRSKYGTLPGAQGGLTLNGDTLIAQATDKFQELRRQINDFEVGNGGVNFGNTAFYEG